jgi:RNA polymerase sigma factor (sigma-70 family)
VEHRLRALVSRAAQDARSDADLLAQLRNDPGAFGELVNRYGSLVWSACRHLLGEADAEDAFQATFLVLLRSTVRDGAALAAWLHGVAVRVALAARRAAARRRRRERVAAAREVVPPPRPDDWADTMAAVHRAVAALPGADRAAFVLCVLHGLTQAEAAARLGRTPGAVAGQVARAKKRLMARLTERGVVPGLVALAAAQAAGAVPPELVERVLNLHRTAAPPAVQRLAGGMPGMTASSKATALAAVAVVAGIAAGILAAGTGPAPEPAPATPVVARAKPVEPAEGPVGPKLDPLPAARGEGADFFGDRLPEGATARIGTLRGGPVCFTGGARLLPPSYGSFFVCAHTRTYLHEAATGKVTELIGTRQGVHAVATASADGRRVAVVHNGASRSLLVLDAATGKVVDTAAEEYSVNDRVTVSFSADGKRLAFPGQTRPGGKEPGLQVVVREVDTATELVRVTVLQNQSASAVLSPDGKTLATFGDDIPGSAPNGAERTVQVWDVATGKLLTTLVDESPNFSAVGTALFAPDGKTLATASLRGTIALWELPGGKRKDTLLGPRLQGECLAFSPDGKTLAALGSGGVVERWSLTENKVLPRTACPVAPGRPPVVDSGPISGLRPARWPHLFVEPAGVAFVDNTRAVAWGRAGERWVAWTVPDGEPLTPASAHFNELQSVQFAPNGREVISIGSDERIVRWDLATGKSKGRAILDFEHRFYPSQLAPGGARGLCDGYVFDTATGAEEFRLPGQLTFPSPDFTRALTVQRELTVQRDLASFTTRCAVWNLETRKRVATLTLPDIDVANSPGNVAVAFSPDNTRLVTVVTVRNVAPGQHGFVVTGWDARTGKKLGAFTGPTVNSDRWAIAAANNNSGAVLTTDDGKLWVADYEKGIRADTIDEGPGRYAHLAFRCPTFSPDGKLFAAGVPTAKPDEFGVRVYAWPSGKILHTFRGHRQEVTALAFSADGKALASGSADSTILVWDLTALGKPK